MIDFKKKLQTLLGHELQVMIEDTPVRDPKAAGPIENANKDMHVNLDDGICAVTDTPLDLH